MNHPGNLATDRGRARIGVIVPVSNANLEPDMQRLRPDGVSIHFMRAGGYDLDAVPDSQQMAGFADQTLEPTLDALGAVRPHGILYGCTSATLAHGPDYDRRFCERISTHSGVPAATAAGALCEALDDLGAKKIGFASPYTRELNAEAAVFLEHHQLRVVESVYVGSDLGNYGQSELAPDAVFALGLRANHEDADAIVLSCTDMRSVEVIETLENETGKPVVTSNQAMMYVMCKRLRLDNSVVGKLGTLTTDEALLR